MMIEQGWTTVQRHARQPERVRIVSRLIQVEHRLSSRAPCTGLGRGR